MWFSPDFACQVIVRIHAKHDLDSQEHVDARAHVIHCAGYLLCYLLTSLPYFTLVDVSDDDAAAIWAAVAEKHLSWVSCTICPQPLLLLGSLHVRSFEWHVRATSAWHCSVTASCFCKAPKTISDMAGMPIKCEAVGQVLDRDKCLVCCCRQKPARLKVPKLTVTQCWLL